MAWRMWLFDNTSPKCENRLCWLVAKLFAKKKVEKQPATTEAVTETTANQEEQRNSLCS